MLITLTLYLSGIACILGAGYFTALVRDMNILYGISPWYFSGPLVLMFGGVALILASVPS